MKPAFVDQSNWDMVHPVDRPSLLEACASYFRTGFTYKDSFSLAFFEYLARVVARNIPIDIEILIDKALVSGFGKENPVVARSYICSMIWSLGISLRDLRGKTDFSDSVDKVVWKGAKWLIPSDRCACCTSKLYGDAPVKAFKTIRVHEACLDTFGPVSSMLASEISNNFSFISEPSWVWVGALGDISNYKEEVVVNVKSGRLSHHIEKPPEPEDPDGSLKKINSFLSIFDR